MESCDVCILVHMRQPFSKISLTEFWDIAKIRNMGSQTHIWEPLGATNGSIKFRGVDFMGLVPATVDLPVTNFEIWTRKAK